MAAHRVEEDLHQPRREVAVEFPGEVGVVRHGAGQQVLLEGELGVGEQHRQFRPGEGPPAPAQGGVVGDGLEFAVERPALLQRLDQRQMVGELGEAAVLGDRERQGLQVVVPQAQRRHLVGHRGEELVAHLRRELAGMHQPAQRDLDVDLQVGGIDPGGIVDGIGVDAAAVERVLDAPVLRHRQVGAFAHHAGPQLFAGDADRVVGAVAGIGVGLVGTAHIGADAAEPEQVDLGLQYGADHLVGGHRLVAQAQRPARLGEQRHVLEGARIDPAALGDQVLVVVLPAGAGHGEQPGPLAQALFRVGVGVDEDVAMVEGGDQPDLRGEQHGVAEDVAAHVADAHHGEGRGLDVAVELAEMPLHRLPAAARGDPHLLVIISGRTA